MVKKDLSKTKKSLTKLAVDLNYPESNIWRIVQFYRAYPILSTVSRELSWSHHVELLITKNREERSFYEVQSIRNSWSVRELRKRIKSDEYKTKLPAEEEIKNKLIKKNV